MTKTELVAKIAFENAITKAAATTLLDSTFTLIANALASGAEVTIHGFGKFTVKKAAAREGRNPRDGSPVSIPAKRKAVFQAQKALKDALNQ